MGSYWGFHKLLLSYYLELVLEWVDYQPVLTVFPKYTFALCESLRCDNHLQAQLINLSQILKLTHLTFSLPIN